jgi:hypothetical protein
LPRVALGTKIPVDPGTHVIAAHRESLGPARKVVLLEGAEAVVKFEVENTKHGDVIAPSQQKTGTVTGAVAWHRRSQLLDRCGGSNFDPQYQNELDAFRHYRTTSALSFFVGAAATSLGGVLLLTMPSRSEPRGTGLRVVPRIGLGELGLEGSY